MAWARHGHGMTSVNQTRPHCVNQMGKTHSKYLAARPGKCESDTAALCKSNGKDTFLTLRGTAWQRNGMGTACCVWIGLYCDSVHPVPNWITSGGQTSNRTSSQRQTSKEEDKQNKQTNKHSQTSSQFNLHISYTQHIKWKTQSQFFYVLFTVHLGTIHV